MLRFPFLRPQPPRLSQLIAGLQEIEASGIYSNYGPVNTRLEAALTDQVFAGREGCLTVNNATTGLMLTIREATAPGERRLALMPSFTFAATAHATIWVGLTPLPCDIDPHAWVASHDAEDALLDEYGDRIACVVPYACFGNGIDLERYARLARDRGVGIVVDAAASLGSLDAQGKAFGTDFPHAVVYSMHATKTFATAEAGLIHSGDLDRLDRLRTMGNFGFGEERSAVMPGLNAKLSEVGALLGLARLEGFDAIVRPRSALADAYRSQLPDLQLQEPTGTRLAFQFMPVLLPVALAPRRARVIAGLQARGVGSRHYFSPHLAEQPCFAEHCLSGSLDVTAQISERSLSLPMGDEMTLEEVGQICQALRDAIVDAS